MTIAVSPDGLPALVLNADYRPLSYYPLSLWSWQDAIKAVFLDRVNIVAEYEHSVSSPTFSMKLPSVVSLKTYIKPSRNPAFTRFNVFLRDRFQCQYCGTPEDLTFDHVVPRRCGGATTWENVVAACSPCNLRKGGMLPAQAKMWPLQKPYQPTVHDLHNNGKRVPAQLSARKLDGLPLLGCRTGALIDRLRGGPARRGRRQAPSTRLAITFHPAKDSPSTRSAALSQEGGTIALRASSRLPPVSPGSTAPQSVGPCHQAHSTPAW